MPMPNDDRDGLRRCRDCDEWKPLEQFHASPRRPSGRGSYCKPCYNVRSRASSVKRAAAEGRVIKAREKLPEGHRRCPDCKEVRDLQAFPRSKSGKKGRGAYCRPCHSVHSQATTTRLHGSTRQYHLKRRYGMTEADFDRVLAEQGGVCAICGAADPRHVDHDHRSGGVRGILCFTCNGGLGLFRDSELYLSRAIGYLRDSSYQALLIEPGVWRILPRRRRPMSSSTL